MRGNKAGLADVARLLKEAQVQRAQTEQTAYEQTKRHPLTDIAAAQDTAAFRRAVQTVTLLKSPARAQHAPRASLAAPNSAPRRAAAMGVETQCADVGVSDGGEIKHLLCAGGTAFVRNNMAPDTVRHLRRGHWRASAELDLHGLRIEQARHAVLSFVSDCLEHDMRCVRVIHGKGYGSPDLKPVLKNKVRAWLIQMPQVQAFTEAPADAGGAGALLVLLKPNNTGK